MDSSSSEENDEEMRRVMYQRASTRLTNTGHRFYKDHFKKKKMCVELLSDDVDGDGTREAWLGKEGTDMTTSKNELGEYVPQGGVAGYLSAKNIVQYPLGGIALVQSNESTYRWDQDSAKSFNAHEATISPVKSTRSVKSSVDDFIVADGVIDPPRKGRRKQKKTIDDSDEEEHEVIQLTETEEDSPKKKNMGRTNAAKEEVVAEPPKKRGRGRPPKNTIVEPPKRNEISPKRDNKTKASPVKRGGKGKELAESSDDSEIDVLGGVEPVQRMSGGGGGKSTKSNGKNEPMRMTKRPDNLRFTMPSDKRTKEDEPPTKTRRSSSLNEKSDRVIRPRKEKKKEEESDEEMDEEPIRNKGRGRPPKNKGKTEELKKKDKRRLNADSDSDDEMEDKRKNTRKGRKSNEKEKKKRKGYASSEESDDEEEEEVVEVPSRRRTSNSVEGRGRGQNRKINVDTLFGEDDESDEDNDDSDEEETSKKGSRRKDNSRKRKTGNEKDAEFLLSDDDDVRQERRKDSSTAAPMGETSSRRVLMKREKKKKEQRKKNQKKKEAPDGTVRVNSKRMREADETKEKAQEALNSRSQSRSRDIPTARGRRSTSPGVGGSPGGSRSRQPSPESDEDQRIREVELRKQLTKIVAQQEREEIKKREKEKEKKQAEAAAAAAATPLPPISSGEKTRMRAKVMLRPTKDPFITEFPASISSTRGPSKRVPRPVSSGIAGRGEKRQSMTATPSIHYDPLDNIMGEMDQSFPAEPTLQRPSTNAHVPYANPSSISTYAPVGIGGGRDTVNKRIEYRGEIREGRREGREGRKEGGEGRREGGEERREGREERREGGEEGRRGEQGRGGGRMDDFSAPLNDIQDDPMEGETFSPPLNGGGSIEDPPAAEGDFNEPPASPDNREEVEEMEMDGRDGRRDGGGGAKDGDDEVVVIKEKLPTKVKRLPVDLGDPRRIDASEVFNSILYYVNRGEDHIVIDALNWKWTEHQRNHFDNSSNRDFIYKMIDRNVVPSDAYFDCLRRINDWDFFHIDGTNEYLRMKQSDYPAAAVVNPRLSLSFLNAPIRQVVRGVEALKTPLSEAVRLGKFQWAFFLLTAGSPVNRPIITHWNVKQQIMHMAIEMVQRVGSDRIDMIRLLLSFGADRASALRYVDGIKVAAERENPELKSVNAFRAAHPYWDKLRQIVALATTSVEDIFKAKLERERSISSRFAVDWVGSTVCSLPDLNFLDVEFRSHYEQIELNRDPSKHHKLVFAVIIGVSGHNVVTANQEDREFFRDVTIGDINVEYDGREPFILKPTSKVEGDKINDVALERVETGLNVFIVPPSHNDRFESFNIELVEGRVDESTIVFAGLARLTLKNGGTSVEEVQVALQAMHRGRQFERVFDNL